MTVICSTGMPGSGKDTIAEVARSLGLPVQRLGDLVRAEAEARGWTGPEGVARTASTVREEEGTDAWALRLVQALPPGMVLVDGVRSLHEVEVLRDHRTPVHIVAVHASPTTRHGRLMERARSDDVLDAQWLLDRDHRELGYGLGGVIAMADHVVVNEGTLEAFQEAVHSLLNGLREEDVEQA